jgi:uncharacterized protein YnzC (UPF0291/DUF896 family)
MYKLVAQLDSLGQFVTKHLKRLSMPPEETENSLLRKGLDTIEQIMKQDLECTKEGHRIKEGTAKDRRVSITDSEMRRGHKSKSMRFEGFKRHVGNALESGLIVAVAITPANRPESEALKPALEQVTKLGQNSQSWISIEPICRRQR